MERTPSACRQGSRHQRELTHKYSVGFGCTSAPRQRLGFIGRGRPRSFTWVWDNQKGAGVWCHVPWPVPWRSIFHPGRGPYIPKELHIVMVTTTSSLTTSPIPTSPCLSILPFSVCSMLPNQGNTAPWRHLTMSGDTLGCHNWERCYWHLAAAKPLPRHRTASTQRMTWPQMSTVPWLRNPGLDSRSCS